MNAGMGLLTAITMALTLELALDFLLLPPFPPKIQENDDDDPR